MNKLSTLKKVSLLFFLLCCFILCVFLYRKTANKQEVDLPYYLLDSTYIGVSTVAQNLDVPWEIAWGPDNQLWFTEQSGRISKVDPGSGNKKTILVLRDVYRERTAGLLGMVLHPDMAKNPYVFIAYSAYKNDTTHVSKIVRYTYKQDTLIQPVTILEYPAWKGHFGARVSISPDEKVIIATGDGAQNGNAQNISSPNGKILRYNIDGSIPADNPFPNNAVWAWGFRNPQGLVYSSKGSLFNSEHGDATDDEVNLINEKGNYGWPNVEGYIDKNKEKTFSNNSTIVEPLISWTPTIAPAGLAYYAFSKIPEWQNSLLLATLKGNSLRSLSLNSAETKITQDNHFFEREFGRIRAVCVSPTGDVYLSTSNRDWNPNGFAEENDDRILRIFKLDKKPTHIASVKKAKAKLSNQETVSKGEALYTSYCSSCHKPNGRGVPQIYPSLVSNNIVKGEKTKFITLILEGKNEMPNFSFLEDKELAILLTYVRKKFAPKTTNITGKEVMENRKNKP
ncbi:PQQ-dependent sugar dehydrogenase [Olivibacter domesticus]|uniref:Glucose/arabinose dehydrogenase, beta-propeller fold n=1 Tax=Olivibacter domesticus TaxID=407022 RepID=A0A1H7QIP0_OLID1|nr:PQQ-dependent sugar dehydrogenase [Olivibacter domesticus]SEL47455.1 Glucose/arabinose dehydrogenase, beta-propeller fold [Olivibacter domesticus]